MIGGRVVAVVLAVLSAVHAVPAAMGQDQPDPLEAAAKRLATGPWFAVIEAVVRPNVEPGSGQDPFTEDQVSEMSVWYDPAPKVRLELGLIRVEVTPGRLTAAHDRNRKAYYEVSKANATIAEMIASELPPLWCPWLAIALEGNAGAWPRVGPSGETQIVWRMNPAGGGGGVEMRFDYVGTADNRAEALDLTVYAGLDGERRNDTFREGTARVGRYGIIHRGQQTAFEFTATGWADRWTRRPDEPWQPIDLDDRRPVASLADLAPPPPEIAPGDRLPSLSLPCVSADDLVVRRWKPTEVFAAVDDARRPGALVLLLTTPAERAGDWLASASALIRDARAEAVGDDRRVPVLARPVIATRTEEVGLDRLRPLLGRWLESARPDPTIPEAEAGTPDFAWAPRSMLLDRVAPGADHAYLVIDRGGWIVGVLAGDAAVAELAGAIREAAR